MRDGFALFTLFAGLCAGLIVGICIGGILNDRVWQRCAVETGHAEYYLDGDRAVWRWKEIYKEGK